MIPSYCILNSKIEAFYLRTGDYADELYYLIDRLWHEIEKKAEKLELEFPEHPSRTLSNILEWHTTDLFEARFPPESILIPDNQLSILLQEQQRVRELLSSFKRAQTALTQENKEVISQLRNKALVNEEYRFVAVELFCLKICFREAKKDICTRRHLRALMETIAQLQSHDRQIQATC